MPRQEKVTRWDSGPNLVKSKPITMAEPQHRLLNRGDSNFSVHSYPSSKSAAQQIKDICLHYVNKCSGQYLHNKTAARYVHQMADEVLNQIGGLISQISSVQSEPEAYQALLQEFKDAFPAHLSSPKQVAAKLNKLQEDYDQLKSAQDEMKQTHKKEIESILLSINDQIIAHKVGILKERRHHKSKIDDISFEANQKLIEERTMILNEKNEMEKDFLNQINTMQTMFAKEMNQLQLKIKTLENELLKTKDDLENMDDDNQEKATEIMLLKSKIRRLEDEEMLSIGKSPRSDYALDSARVSDAGSEMYDDDRSVISSYSFADTVTETNTLNTETLTINTQEKRDIFGDGTKDGTSRDRRNVSGSKSKIVEGINGTTGATEDNKQTDMAGPRRSRRSSGGGSGSDGRYLKIAKSMKKRLVKAKEEKKVSDQTIVELKNDIQTLTDNNKLLTQQVRDITEINKELRKAIAIKYQIGDPEVKEDTSKISTYPPKTSQPHPLCHTPHFLGKADTTQLRKNLRQHIFTGVQNYGKF